MDDLTSIPGIGHYTAAAIRNFAFNLPTPCIDTNIRRILHRTFIGPENADGSWSRSDENLLKIAQEILLAAIRNNTTAEWHAALMDFGSLIQTKRNPKWDICPLTAKNIMKTTPKTFSTFHFPLSIRTRKEPGRLVGSTFIPNRIFRGRIVEALRDAPRGLTLHDIGKQIALDWDPKEHRGWLSRILDRLKEDRLLLERRNRYVLG